MGGGNRGVEEGEEDLDLRADVDDQEVGDLLGVFGSALEDVHGSENLEGLEEVDADIVLLLPVRHGVDQVGDSGEDHPVELNSEASSHQGVDVGVSDHLEEKVVSQGDELPVADPFEAGEGSVEQFHLVDDDPEGFDPVLDAPTPLSLFKVHEVLQGDTELLFNKRDESVKVLYAEERAVELTDPPEDLLKDRRFADQVPLVPGPLGVVSQVVEAPDPLEENVQLEEFRRSVLAE